jgi:hypothetical protein
MALLSVSSGRDRLGSIRQRKGNSFEAFDVFEKSLGIFDTPAEAANAVADAAPKQEE